jgi:hypothetical protein
MLLSLALLGCLIGAGVNRWSVFLVLAALCAAAFAALLAADYVVGTPELLDFGFGVALGLSVGVVLGPPLTLGVGTGVALRRFASRFARPS